MKIQNLNYNQTPFKTQALQNQVIDELHAAPKAAAIYALFDGMKHAFEHVLDHFKIHAQESSEKKPASELKFYYQKDPSLVQQSNQTKEIANVKKNFLGLTQAKTKIVALRTLSGASFVSAGTLMGLGAAGVVSLPISAISIPLLAAAGLLLWKSSQIVDYEDMNVLRQLREEASGLPLSQILEKHPIKDIFQYGIIFPEEFPLLYREKVKDMDLNQVFSFYESTCREYSAIKDPLFTYEIPHPRECQYKWKNETQSKKCDEILKTYSLEKLEKYEILQMLDPELYLLKNLNKQYLSERDRYNSRARRIQQNFEDSTARERVHMHEWNNQAQNEYDNHWAHQQLSQLENEYFLEIKRLENFKIQLTEEAQKKCDAVRFDLTHGGIVDEKDLPEFDRALLKNAEKDLEMNCIRIERNCQAEIRDASSRYDTLREESRRELKTASLKRDRLIQLAKEEFEAVTVNQRRFRDEQNEHNRNQLNTKVATINNEFNAFRRK